MRDWPQILCFWREFSNRRQVGACVGLVPQPYDSGESQTDQGISKQGNRRVRALLVEMAWTWLRYQPGSALTQCDPASIPVQRHKRRAKTDRLDAIRLVINRSTGAPRAPAPTAVPDALPSSRWHGDWRLPCGVT